MAPPHDHFRRHRIQQAIEAMEAVVRRRAVEPPAMPTRRRFLQAGLAGAVAASLPLLSACGGDDAGDARMALFFNYSHLDHQGKSMWMQLGRASYRLRPVAEVPEVLERERQRNRFLRAVDDRFITHVVEGVPPPPPDGVSFHYGATEGVNGEWTLDSVNLLLPEAGVEVAFQRMLDAAGAGGAVPLSAKRRKYGLPPAMSARDLYEEQALHDTVSHGATLIAMQKDMLALDGAAASTVVNNYVMQTLDPDDIDDQIGALGTALPQRTPGKTNPTGWATLRPLLDAGGQPRRIAQPGDPSNGRIVYVPVLHPQIATLVGQGIVDVLPGVQNDASLGADITDKPAGSTLRGKLWVSRDGQPAVVNGGDASSPAGAVGMAVSWPNGQNHWLECTATNTPLGDGAQQLQVSYSNIALRYLSCYIEFYDEAGKLLPVGTMPDFSTGYWVSAPPNFSYDRSDGSATRIGIGTISSLGTVMGIPVFTDPAFYGSLDISLKLSRDVSRVRLYAGGLGTGSNNHSDTIAGGVAGTMIVNYILTTLFGALGAIPFLDQAFSLILAGGSELISAFASGINDDWNGNEWLTATFWQDQGINLLNLLLNVVAGSNDPILRSFGEGLAELIGEADAVSAIEKAIPVVGLILNIESAAVAVADFALTTVAIAQSPFTYVTDLVFTHDITVTIAHDVGNTSFPKAANAMTVIATFDDGKPHRLDFSLQAPGYPNALPPVVFKAVPYGGKVDIAVSFYQKAAGDDAAANILLGRGSTGKVDNDDHTPYAITITEKAYPVGPDTKYRHVQRSYLDGSGAHVWVREAAPSTPPSQFPCGGAGQICQFNGIAVRQGTATTATMLGYAWRGQNLAGGGDLGQQALMNAETPAAGYAHSDSPAAVAGLDIVFSGLAGGSNNFYVDPTGALPMIRGIALDTGGAPTFDSPTSNRAYGRLNLQSDLLLVHPGGHLVSISGANDRFEVLRPPRSAVSDAAANAQLIAQVMGGSGALPGKLSNVAAATITLDGTLLMLENGNNRIQAFDIACNPVRYFGSASKSYFLPLTEMPQASGWQHLDLQADIGGLLYVLSSNTQTGVYRLSIYNRLSPLEKAVSVTEGILAANIGLDHWRDLYTLNYQPITVQGSNARPATTEPSVSLWTPAATG